MKILKLQEFTPPPGREMERASYPKDGYYFGRMFGTDSIICVSSGGGVSYYGLPELAHLVVDEKPVQESTGAISEQTLLKALAIVARPEAVAASSITFGT